MTTLNTFDFGGHIPVDRPRGNMMIPFVVPEGTTRLEITYACYPDLSKVEPWENPHDHIADFAIFDPRGAEFMGKGFRGTSGNTRMNIFIGMNEATPGYTPGPIQAGEWNIMMGFYKIGPQGTRWELHVTAVAGELEAAAEPPKGLPVRTTSTHPVSATGWYKGELHCHTFHSDGQPSPEEVVRRAERLGLDYLAITDHNVFTQQIDLNTIKTDLILIPGCEVTTFNGHWNIWGDAGHVEFRVNSTEEMNAAIADANQRGYLTSLNHPRPEGPPWRFPDSTGNVCIEAWNGHWEDKNDICMGFWVDKLNQGKRLVAVCGSDAHELNVTDEHGLAEPTSYVYCPGAPSAAAILAAIRLGHVFITCKPTGPQMYLTSGSAMGGDAVKRPASGKLSITLHIIDGVDAQLEIETSKGQVDCRVLERSDVTQTIEVDVADALYVRAQLREPRTGNMLALTNPIYLDD